MNYIEFEIGGKLRGFKFGLGFLGDIQKHFDVDFDAMQKMTLKNPILFLPAMLYYGHKHSVIRKRQPITFELYEFEDWMEDLKGGITNENIMNAVNAMNVGIQHIMGKEEETHNDTDNDTVKKK